MATEETYMTVAQKLIAEGLREGQREGRAELLLALLHQRFGALPAGAAEQVRAAPSADLDRWVGRLLTAPTLDAIFAP